MANNPLIFRYDEQDYPLVFVQSVKIVENLLSNKVSCLQLFGNLAKKFPLFGSTKRPSELKTYEYIMETLNKGIFINSNASDKAVLQRHPSRKELHLNVKYLFCKYKEKVSRNRCILILVCKLLLEVSHALTNNFNNVAGNALVGENGNGFEEDVFRCHIAITKELYAHPLVLIAPNCQNLPLSSKYVADDTDIEQAVECLKKGGHMDMGKLKFLHPHSQLLKPVRSDRQDAKVSASSTTQSSLSQHARSMQDVETPAVTRSVTKNKLLGVKSGTLIKGGRKRTDSAEVPIARKKRADDGRNSPSSGTHTVASPMLCGDDCVDTCASPQDMCSSDDEIVDDPEDPISRLIFGHVSLCGIKS